jgi:hypothetical protein
MKLLLKGISQRNVGSFTKMNSVSSRSRYGACVEEVTVGSIGNLPYAVRDLTGFRCRLGVVIHSAIEFFEIRSFVINKDRANQQYLRVSAVLGGGVLSNVFNQVRDSISNFFRRPVKLDFEVIGAEHQYNNINRVMALKTWNQVGLAVTAGLLVVFEISRATAESFLDDVVVITKLLLQASSPANVDRVSSRFVRLLTPCVGVAITKYCGCLWVRGHGLHFTRRMFESGHSPVWDSNVLMA